MRSMLLLEKSQVSTFIPSQLRLLIDEVQVPPFLSRSSPAKQDIWKHSCLLINREMLFPFLGMTFLFSVGIRRTPVTVAKQDTFEQMKRASVRLAKLVSYVSASTIECKCCLFISLRQSLC